MSHYTISSPNIVTVHICSKLETSWKSVVFTNKVGKHSQYFLGVFNKTVILLTLVGYEMIIANSYPMHTHGIIVKYTVEIKKDYSLGSIYSENSIGQTPEEQSQVHTYIPLNLLIPGCCHQHQPQLWQNEIQFHFLKEPQHVASVLP